MSDSGGPSPLGEALSDVLRRFRRVDLDVTALIRDRWKSLVGDALAARSRPDVVRGTTLYVTVVSGATATVLSREQSRILRELEDLGEQCPTSIRATVGDLENPS